MPRNLIDITDLSVEEINQLIATAEDIIANPVKYQDACAHKHHRAEPYSIPWRYFLAFLPFR